jgi:hypothetical protein
MIILKEMLVVVSGILGNYINLNWEGFSADYMALFLNEHTLRLVGVNAPAHSVELLKK